MVVLRKQWKTWSQSLCNCGRQWWRWKLCRTANRHKPHHTWKTLLLFLPLFLVLGLLTHVTRYCGVVCRSATEVPDGMFVGTPIHPNYQFKSASKKDSRESTLKSARIDPLAEPAPGPCGHHDKVQAARRQAVAETCRLQNISQDLPVQFSNQVLVDDDRKLIVCSTFKTGSTVWRYLMLTTNKAHIKVHGDMLKIAKGPIIPKRTDGNLHWYGIKDIKNYPDEEIKQRIKDYFKIMFVRNPLDRLVSAFRDKYTPGHPGFDPNYYKLIMQDLDKKYQSMNAYEIPPLKWHKFVDYVINLEAFGEKMYYDNHIDTLNNLCRPCVVNYNFIAKFEDFHNEKECVFSYLTNNYNSSFPNLSRTRNSAQNFSGGNTTNVVASLYKNLTLAQYKAVLHLYNRDCLLFGYKCDAYS